MLNIDCFLKSPNITVSAINEQGYIFISSLINAEKRAASQDSIISGLTSIHWVMPEMEQLSNPIFLFEPVKFSKNLFALSAFTFSISFSAFPLPTGLKFKKIMAFTLSNHSGVSDMIPSMTSMASYRLPHPFPPSVHQIYIFISHSSRFGRIFCPFSMTEA